MTEERERKPFCTMAAPYVGCIGGAGLPACREEAHCDVGAGRYAIGNGGLTAICLNLPSAGGEKP